MPLTPQGEPAGAPKVEFSLEGLGPDGNDKARKISFDKANNMLLNGAKFTFNLAPPAAQVAPTTYTFRFNEAIGSWSFVDAISRPGSLTNN